MTLTQLRYVVEVADAGSITAAAARLFIAQPSLSKAVGELEAASELVRSTMEGVAQLRVPLIAEVSYGSNWAEAK